MVKHGGKVIKLNHIYTSDAIQFLKSLENNSVDLIIADYPFNCQDGRRNYLNFINETAIEFYREKNYGVKK